MEKYLNRRTQNVTRELVYNLSTIFCNFDPIGYCIFPYIRDSSLHQNIPHTLREVKYFVSSAT